MALAKPAGAYRQWPTEDTSWTQSAMRAAIRGVPSSRLWTSGSSRPTSEPTGWSRTTAESQEPHAGLAIAAVPSCVRRSANRQGCTEPCRITADYRELQRARPHWRRSPRATAVTQSSHSASGKRSCGAVPSNAFEHSVSGDGRPTAVLASPDYSPAGSPCGAPRHRPDGCAPARLTVRASGAHEATSTALTSPYPSEQLSADRRMKYTRIKNNLRWFGSSNWHERTWRRRRIVNVRDMMNPAGEARERI